MIDGLLQESSHQGGDPHAIATGDGSPLGSLRSTVFRPRLGLWQILAIGAILATGKRTVTSALRIMGLSHEDHFTNYHRVLNRAAWCPAPPVASCSA